RTSVGYNSSSDQIMILALDQNRGAGSKQRCRIEESENEAEIGEAATERHDKWRPRHNKVQGSRYCQGYVMRCCVNVVMLTTIRNGLFPPRGRRTLLLANPPTIQLHHLSPLSPNESTMPKTATSESVQTTMSSFWGYLADHSANVPDTASIASDPH